MRFTDLASTALAATEAAQAALGEGIATFREALPEPTRVRAEEAVVGDSALRRSLVSLVEATADRVEEAGRRAVERVEHARAEVGEAIQVGADADGGISGAVQAAAQAAAPEEAAVQGSRGSFWKAALAVVAVGAAAGAGYTLWNKKRAAARAHLSGEGDWGVAPAPESRFVPGMADTQSPDAVDEQFAKEVDEASNELAEDFIEAVEGHVEHPPAPEEPFQPGMADTQSPDAVDEEFAKEVDEAADELAADIVEAIEEPKNN